MHHPQVRRIVAGIAAAGVTMTVPLATSASPAQASTGSVSDSTGNTSTTSSSTASEAGSETGSAVQRVRLRVKNQDVRPVRTDRTWARRLLADENISYDGNDLVRVRRGGELMRGSDQRRLRAGDAVQVIAVDRVDRTRRVMIEPPTRTRTVQRLPAGKREVVAPGRPGVKKIRAVKTRHNRAVVDVDRTTRVVRAPKPRRVIVGAPERSVPGTAGLNWGALANCESSGNPRAVNPAGYYGLYQFDLGTWRSVGGSGVPSNASASEQTYRAKLLYQQRGRSPWPTCGRLL